MTLIVRNSSGAIIDQSTFKFPVSALDEHGDTVLNIYKMKKELFEVYTPFYLDSQAQRLLREAKTDLKSHIDEKETSAQRKRRKKKPPILSDEELKVSEFLERVLPSLIKEAKEYHLFLDASKDFLQSHDNNKTSRLSALDLGCGDLFQELCMQQTEESLTFLETNVFRLNETFLSKNYPPSHFIHTLVENPDDVGVKITIKGHQHFIPSGSRFLMSSFSMLVSQLYGFLTVPTGYDLIVLDPPWHNKSVKRKKSYNTFDDSQLFSLPIGSLCKSDGLVCVWVTNNERLLSSVKDDLFPAWRVKWIADWVWMKVTQCAEPVCDIRSSHKKPYERLVIGRLEEGNKAMDKSSCVQESLSSIRKHTGEDGIAIEEFDVKKSSKAVKDVPSHIPRDFVLVSVPCSLHSKKPPISETLSPYLPANPKCLELFARNLLPGWTSWGNEVLRHQHGDYYEIVT